MTWTALMWRAVVEDVEEGAVDGQRGVGPPSRSAAAVVSGIELGAAAWLGSAV